jgi:RNA polymerase sigma-70 factor, ECF subfamily
MPQNDVPDVVQEVFKSVSENIDRFQKNRPKDTFRGWLRVITRNKSMDVYRRRGKQPNAAGGSEALQQFAALASPESIDPTDADENESDEKEVRSILFQQALEFIKGDVHERTWRAFWRVVVDECTPAEVADELQMTPGAVRVAKCRVLQRLRQDLGDPLFE